MRFAPRQPQVSRMSEASYASWRRMRVSATRTLFALQIQMLMLGAIVAAVYGDLDAAKQARDVARLLLERDGIHTGS